MDHIASSALSLRSKFTRNQSIFASIVDDELVMMDGEQGLYFGLNPVARKIWELLETPMSYEKLLDSLTRLYEVDREQCQRDIEPFLLKMIEHNLVIVTLE